MNREIGNLGPLKAFHERLRSSGKPNKAIVTAVARKLLTMLNAMLRGQAVWNPAPQPGCC